MLKRGISVVIASASKLKRAAVEQAFASCKDEFEKAFKSLSTSPIYVDPKADFSFNFLSQNYPSGINEQPIGWEEIIKGANTRVNNAHYQTSIIPEIIVSIENGLVHLPEAGPDYWMDIAWVVLFIPSTSEKFSACSTSVRVPSHLANQISEGDNAKVKTIGDLLHEEDKTISSKNPHLQLLGGLMDRIPLMEQAVSSCLGQWMASIKQK